MTRFLPHCAIAWLNSFHILLVCQSNSTFSHVRRGQEVSNKTLIWLHSPFWTVENQSQIQQPNLVHTRARENFKVMTHACEEYHQGLSHELSHELYLPAESQKQVDEMHQNKHQEQVYAYWNAVTDPFSFLLVEFISGFRTKESLYHNHHPKQKKKFDV